MSIFVSSKALEQENRKFKRSSKVMKKVKFGTNLKTKKCSLELYHTKCKPATHTVNDGKRVFMICDKHFSLYRQQYETFKPSYLKANIIKDE